ncbi:hypothetical protein [Gaoshiqia sediminis]|uniref:Outer membrane protein beta-barrel domain-containing protein n=1 Tax=Gaoshiqia sediminis TaxID=2986998 RepID=A0AA42CB51_9BACT|nr:hypothetical protein [Gaoshiqia sediminis]MCW0484772.1 hypothetical protein [Gaoshiqia sediminis]
MKITILTVLLFFGQLVYAQDHPENHDHHRNHVGFGLGATSIFAENNLAPGLHVHYSYRLSDHSPFSLGVGYEAILDKHTHSTVTGLLGYELGRILISAGPGVTFGKEDGETHRSLSGHLELAYEFSVGDFHLGPMAGFGFDREESHASVGVHVGFGF